MMTTTPAAVRLLVEGEECTLGEFIEANEDLDPEEVVALYALDIGESYVGGGGAWGRLDRVAGRVVRPG